MSLSVVQKARSSDIASDPYPHIVIENALPQSLYDQLAAEFPSLETLTRGVVLKNNFAYYLPAIDSRHDRRISSLWQNFIEHHTSPAFLREVAGVFSPYIAKHYPWIEHEVGRPVHEFTVAERFPGRERNERNRGGDIVLDCQVGINSPVSKESSVIGPHVDSPYKLFAGMYYLRDPRDTSTGGDIRVLRSLDAAYAFSGNEINPPAGKMEVVRTVPYRANSCLIWLNTPAALHDVTPRSVTDFPRRAVNLLGESYTLARGPYFTPNVSRRTKPTIASRIARKLGLGV